MASRANGRTSAGGRLVMPAAEALRGAVEPWMEPAANDLPRIRRFLLAWPGGGEPRFARFVAVAAGLAAENGDWRATATALLAFGEELAERGVPVAGWLATASAERRAVAAKDTGGAAGDGLDALLAWGMPIVAAGMSAATARGGDAGTAARQADLERSNAELQHFAEIVSHDLEEPLRTIVSYTDLLAARYGAALDDRGRRYLSHTAEGARRMQRLVRDLLLYSRVGSAELPAGPVDLAAIARAVVRDLTVAIHEAGVTVSVGELPVVRGDGRALGQVLQNLVGNAIKFRPEADGRVALSSRRDGEMWVITVHDNGIGIPIEHQERVFEMFQRLQPRGSGDGSGLGLAIARRIVERHGGRLWVESAVGEGTSFSFSVPGDSTREGR